MKLFRKDPEKVARQAAAREEIKRLRALSTKEFALLAFPGYNWEKVDKTSSLRSQELCLYLLRDFPDARHLDTLDLLAPMRRTLEMLEEHKLVRATYHQRSPVWHITERGDRVLDTGTLADVLADEV
jgi:hypothetical protein